MAFNKIDEVEADVPVRTAENAAETLPPIPATYPDNEPARLEALRRYQVLDTAAEQCYDDLTALASMICATPVALLSLVDHDRQWFKARVGMNDVQ